MLNFILNNTIFDYIIIILFFINFILTMIIDLKEQRKELKSLFLLDNIKQIKIGTMIIAIIISTIITYIKFCNLIRTLIYFVLPAVLLIKNIFDTYKKEQSLSIDDKYSKLWSICIFIIFFSSKSIPIYYKFLSPLNHNLKKILLIIYLLMKVILFTFIFLTSIAILLSNISILKPFNLKDSKTNDIFYKFKDYNFHFYKKTNSKTCLIVDVLIYFLLSIPTILFNLINIIYLKLRKKLKLFKNHIIKIVYNFNNNNNKVIRKITNISIIITFSLVHIITIINSSLFNDKIVQIYSFLSTVILIPFIYDSIKSK